MTRKRKIKKRQSKRKRNYPSPNPNPNPNPNPSPNPSSNPSLNPSSNPSLNPSPNPSSNPSPNPSPNPSSTSNLPLKLYYNSPHGNSFTTKNLTHNYCLESPLYTKIDEIGNGERLGTVIVNITNCPSYKSNEMCLSLIVAFCIYIEEKIFGNIVCMYNGISQLNMHGIMTDGTYIFYVILGTLEYSYLNPVNGVYTTLSLVIKNGVRELTIIPNNSNTKYINNISIEKIYETHDPTCYYKYFNTSFGSAVNGVQQYSIDSTLVSSPEVLKTHSSESIGSLFWNGHVTRSHINKSTSDFIWFWTYSINDYNTKRHGNIHVLITESNTPLTQQGSWAVAKNNTHEGYILYADGDFLYLNPENKLLKKYFTVIDSETSIRTVMFPKKTPALQQIPREIQPSDVKKYVKFYTGLPTIAGTANSVVSNSKHKSKNSVGAFLPDNINIHLSYTFTTYSLYADIFDLDTDDFIGMSIQTYKNTYINKNPVTVVYAVYYFINDTFIAISGVNGKELNSTGSFKDGTTEFAVICCSNNYGNPLSVTRETEHVNSYVKRSYNVNF